MEKTILLAVDGSSGAHNAIDYMLGTAEPTHAAVILAYVIEWSPYSFNTPEENAERHQRRESEISRANDQVIAPVKDQLESAGFKVSTVVRHGAPAETLIRIAHDFDASNGFWRRIKIVPFNRRFSEQEMDTTLPQKP